MDLNGFKIWMIDKKTLNERSARDVVSRLKRVLHLINIQNINTDTCFLLGQSEEYRALSVSVKSQLKRAVVLYLEFLSNA